MESKSSSAPVVLDTSVNTFLQLSSKIKNQRNVFLKLGCKQEKKAVLLIMTIILKLKPL